MDKVVEDYIDICTSPTGVPLHCQVKKSINMTLERENQAKFITLWEPDFIGTEEGQELETLYLLLGGSYQTLRYVEECLQIQGGPFRMVGHALQIDELPPTFMRLMGNNLRPLSNEFVVVYLYDILIFNQSWEEHFRHIRQVLQTLRQHKLCAYLEKSTFGMTQVQYLGYIIDK
eukprot:PITA_04584